MSKLLRVISISLTTSLTAAGGAAAATPWGPPETVAPVTMNNTRSLDVASDASGTLTALWVGRASGTGDQVLTATRPSGGTWSPAQALQGDVLPSPGGPSGSELSVAPNGYALATWTERGVWGEYLLKTASRTPAGVWSAPETVLPPVTGGGLNNATGFSFVASPVGEAFGLVSRRRFGPRPYDPTYPTEIFTADRPAAGPWSTATSPVGPNTGPVGVDDQGNGLALTANDAGGLTSLSRSPGGTWQPAGDFAPRAVSDTELGAPAVGAQLAVGPGGDAVAIWRRGDFGGGYGGVDAALQAAWRPKGGSWGPVATLDTHRGEGTGSAGSVAIDASGRATVVWEDLSRSGDLWSSNVLSVTGTATGAWSAPTKLATPITASNADLQAQGGGSVPTYGNARVEVGRGGSVAAMFQAYPGDNTVKVWTATRAAGSTTWSPADSIPSMPTYSGGFAVSPSGIATVMGYDSKAIFSSSRSIEDGPTTPVPTPKVRIRIALVPFGAKTCPQTVSVNVGGTRATLPSVPSAAGTTAGLRCRVTGDITLKASTRAGSYQLAWITGTGVLPGLQFLRVFSR